MRPLVRSAHFCRSISARSCSLAIRMLPSNRMHVPTKHDPLLYPLLAKVRNIARPTGAPLCHNASMTTILFRIVQQDLSYAIEVTKGDVAPYTVSGFKTAAEAEAWVADRQFATKVGDRWERLPDPDRRY